MSELYINITYDLYSNKYSCLFYRKAFTLYTNLSSLTIKPEQMKKLFALLTVAGMALFFACAPAQQQEEAVEEQPVVEEVVPAEEEVEEPVAEEVAQ